MHLPNAGQAADSPVLYLTGLAKHATSRKLLHMITENKLKAVMALIQLSNIYVQ